MYAYCEYETKEEINVIVNWIISGFNSLKGEDELKLSLRILIKYDTFSYDNSLGLMLGGLIDTISLEKVTNILKYISELASSNCVSKQLLYFLCDYVESEI